ncbi:Hypothetical protein CINCED_3A022293 [Cinara cedri]|nr:Hypothetical protein CINCED_3A022293 [Cinara cedri]
MRGTIFFIIAMFVINVNSKSLVPCYRKVSWEARVGIKNGDNLAIECETPMFKFCSNQDDKHFLHVLSLCPEYFTIPNCTYECVKSYFKYNCDCLIRKIEKRTLPLSYVYDSILFMPAMKKK